MSLDSLGVAHAAPPKSKQYMDSLVPPDRERFERIAHVQAEKEVEAKRRARDKRKSLSISSMPSPSAAHFAGRRSDEQRADAALMIQKTFRGYRARREMDGFGIDATTRWVTAIREAQFRQLTKPRARPSADEPAAAVAAAVPTLDDPIDRRPSSARRNWQKASLVARRAGHDDDDDDSFSDSDSGSDPDRLAASDSSSAASPEQRAEAKRRRERANAQRRQAAQMMGLQYFLEMVDVKHRYGSNLRMYHEEWKRSDTTDNFFYWLDYGDGRRIELDSCPRDRLDREQVRYLSREERQYYLATVDPDGRLCWAKNGERIDTTERYRDSVLGIVPADDPTPAYRPAPPPAPPETTADRSEGGGPAPPSRKASSSASSSSGSGSGSSSAAESRREADRAAKYADPEYEGAHGVKKITHLSASTVFNKLLRKSVRKNTWIFVADTSFRLYVGIKDSGAFQHSSFLQGSRISAAGLIKVKDGRLSSLSPLSGHYRPPASNFRAFVHGLRETGVDTSHVSISKSYTVLVGLETYSKTRRKGRDLVDRLVRRRDKMMAPDDFRRREEEQRDKSESAEKERRFLARQRRLEEEAAPPSAGDRENRVHQRLETIKSALLIYSTLLGLSPILKSLTRSTSSDSIWAMSFWLLAINIFFFDYSGAVGAKIPASLSTNAALMASTVLASRLPSTKQVFSLTLFSIEVFGLFPVFRRHVRHRSWRYHVVQTVLLVLGAGLGVGMVLGDAQAGGWPWKSGMVGMAVGVLMAGLAAGGCSWWLIGLQKYKNEIRGPWDPARPIIMSRTRWDDR
ncbi:hypothetical protein CDD83_7872 [Cordyceps sp. RAO-2017]|nr:hypothetical protein CDD83_7872 [Cordyceps sp. RAO-2017]